MDKVIIKNISSATVVLSFPDTHIIRRELIPGRSISIPREEYEEMSYDAGFNGLIEAHYLSVSNLGEEDAPVTAAPIYDVKAIADMLDTLNVTAFAKMIPTAAQAEKETIVELAINKGITHPAFVALIKQYCDVDIIEAINRKHQVED